MANVFLKAEKIVAQGLGLLQRELVLVRLVKRLGQADFVGAKNDTVNIRIPSLLVGREYEWRTRTSPIVLDELTEETIPATLNKHPYSGVQITDEELTLDIESWGEQVARPQIRAVAEKLESYIATAMQVDANYRHTVEYIPDPSSDNDRSFSRTLNEARKYLNIENVPAEGRVAVLGANVEEAVLNSGVLQDADRSGSTGVLREAIIGRLSGFTVIGNVNSIDPDFAVAMHPTAFGFANVAPAVPAGVPAGAGLVFDSLAMSWIRDYEAAYLRDRSVYSSFAGAVSFEDGRDLDPETSGDFGALTDENVRAVQIDFASS